MEAVARFDFNATKEDELGFRRGNVLRILDMEDGENWYTAELEGKEGLIPSNYVELEKHNWYFGGITRLDAEKLLSNKPQGSFLIRRSEKPLKDYSMSVKCSDGVNHLKIMRDPRGKYFLWFVKFNFLNELVEYYRTASVSQSEDVRLLDSSLNENLVQALFDFVPQETDKLAFSRGDIITVTDKTDMHWWKGEIGGREGSFPATYVKPC